MVGLFFYDIFFVFKTSFMVTVAQSLDLPIKLIFPRYPVSFFTSSLPEAGRFSLLGNGDILVPAIFLRMISKFEALRGKRQLIYTSSLLSYVMACTIAIVCMLRFNHAQPVLLYIVTLVLITCVLVAVCTGDFKDLWKFEDKAEEEQEKVE
ncbi:hypothetical protein GEMRC1_004666 [Eukaryota sp. GEM-RC1]